MVRKQVVPALFAAAMAVSLAACRAPSGLRETIQTGEAESPAELEQDETGEETTSGEADTGEAEDAGADAKKAVKIGMVVDTAEEEAFFRQSLQAGLSRAAQELGVQVQCLEAGTAAEYDFRLNSLIEEDYDLIIGTGNEMAAAVRKAAQACPNIQFAAIGNASNADLDNVTSIVFDQSQVYYLAGVVAGMTTDSGKTGLIFSSAGENSDLLGYSYCAGVLDANAEAEIFQQEAALSQVSQEEYNSAVEMIDQGADVIFCAAPGSLSEVLEKCREKGDWIIGADPSQCDPSREGVLAVAVQNVEKGIFALAQDCLDQQLQGGVLVYDLGNEGVDLLLSEDNLPKEVEKAAAEIKEKIRSGEITLPGSRQEFEAAYGDVYQLGE